MTPEEIKEIRLQMGLSQEKFAFYLNASFPSVSRWENNKAKPSYVYVKKLKKLQKKHQKFKEQNERK